MGETLYEGPETRIQRAVHSVSGQRLVLKLPVSDVPSLRTVGRLMHEYHILTKQAGIFGVVRAWTSQSAWSLQRHSAAHSP